MSILNISEYAPYIHKMLLGGLKPIAYGVSTAVNLAYPLRPDYFISAEPVEELPEIAKNFWRHKPLETLATEDPAKTLIIVCDGQENAAWKAVSAYGDFPVLRFFSYEFLSPYFPALAALPKTYLRKNKKTPGNRAIVIRGIVDRENHFLSIQKIAHDHPDADIIVSTWDDTDPRHLARLETLCDQLVTSPKPAYAGTQNRNFQATLAQRGLAAATASKAAKCLLYRTDTLFTKASTLDGFDWLMEKFPLGAEARQRQKGRLIIPNLFTRRFMPYCASDLFIYGWTQDVAAFWNASGYDERHDNSPAFLDRGLATPLDVCIRNKVVVESYFWLNYMEKIGRRPLYTVADGLDFLRDYVLVTDLSAQGVLWLSKDFHDHAALCARYKTCMKFADWCELFYAPSQNVASIDLTKAQWQDFVNSPRL